MSSPMHVPSMPGRRRVGPTGISPRLGVLIVKGAASSSSSARPRGSPSGRSAPRRQEHEHRLQGVHLHVRYEAQQLESIGHSIDHWFGAVVDEATSTLWVGSTAGEPQRRTGTALTSWRPPLRSSSSWGPPRGVPAMRTPSWARYHHRVITVVAIGESIIVLVFVVGPTAGSCSVSPSRSHRQGGHSCAPAFWSQALTITSSRTPVYGRQQKVGPDDPGAVCEGVTSSWHRPLTVCQAAGVGNG